MKRLEIRSDCRFYKGGKPCIHNRLCQGCPDFESVGKKILVIKLAAMGDVLRTTALLPALRKKYEPCQITWVVAPSGYGLLIGNPQIDRLFALDLGTVLRLQTELYDVAICLDKEDAATGLIASVKAPIKLGFGLNADGNIRPLNPGADYAFSLGLSDQVKFRENRRTYQDFTFEAAELLYEGQDYVFALSDEERQWAKNRLSELGLNEGDRLLGLNTGAGPVFGTKKWTIDGFVELARLAADRLGARVLLMGGPEEVERNRRIAAELSDLGERLIDTGCDNDLRQFASLVAGLDLLVTGDTLAMHLALAQGVDTVAIFGPTCTQEVQMYGRGEKIVSTLDCAPCYLKRCLKHDHRCMTELTPEKVFEIVRSRWDK